MNQTIDQSGFVKRWSGEEFSYFTLFTSVLFKFWKQMWIIFQVEKKKWQGWEGGREQRRRGERGREREMGREEGRGKLFLTSRWDNHRDAWSQIAKYFDCHSGSLTNQNGPNQSYSVLTCTIRICTRWVSALAQYSWLLGTCLSSGLSSGFTYTPGHHA